MKFLSICSPSFFVCFSIFWWIRLRGGDLDIHHSANFWGVDVYVSFLFGVWLG